jgi:2-iminobutanoate/2-iminopropanoate deaminase
VGSATETDANVFNPKRRQFHMSRDKAGRRRFLYKGLAAATAATSAGAVPALAFSKASGARVGKLVIRKPGDQAPLSSILSPGIRLGNLIFVSGQGAHDPKTHKVGPGPFPNQVRQCLENVKAVLDTAGSSLDRVVKCTVFLTDIANYDAMNKVYHEFFPTDPPARSTMAVRDLPGESPVEIECIAYVD